MYILKNFFNISAFPPLVVRVFTVCSNLVVSSRFFFFFTKFYVLSYNLFCLFTQNYSYNLQYIEQLTSNTPWKSKCFL